VLRRHKDGRPATRHAEVLGYAAGHDFPDPALYDAVGPDLVLERLNGPEMQQALRPWNLARHAVILARLHRALHAIPPMPGLEARFGEPTSFLHLDLHPRNVILTVRGPVVIDWANAANGPAQADVALVYVIGATSAFEGPPWRRPIEGALRRRFLDVFLRGAADPSYPAVLPAVAAWRRRDPNIRPDERERIDRLVARVTLET